MSTFAVTVVYLIADIGLTAFSVSKSLLSPMGEVGFNLCRRKLYELSNLSVPSFWWFFKKDIQKYILNNEQGAKFYYKKFSKCTTLHSSKLSNESHKIM